MAQVSAPVGVPAQRPEASHATWPDTPSTREFRQRVLELAVIYGDSSGIDENGYKIATTDLGPTATGCHVVQAVISWADVVVRQERFDICKK